MSHFNLQFPLATILSWRTELVCFYTFSLTGDPMRRFIKRSCCPSGALLMALLVVSNATGQLQTPTDVYSLKLISADLEDADKTLAMKDLNDDDLLDKKEMASLRWADDAKKVDLNGDGKLTHLEIAIHFASVRDEKDVEQIDRTVANRAMRKHDANRNGQIDPGEISSAWPEEPDEIDVNGDGILTLNELTEAFAFRRVVRSEFGIIGVDQGWAIKLRNRFDENQDGGLNKREWDAAPLPDRPEKFDEDKDDRLSLMEIATMLAKHRQSLGLTAKDQLASRALIGRFDRDGDSKVTLPEWKPLQESFPDPISDLLSYDTNSDETIELLEIEKTLSKRRDEKGYSDSDAAMARRLIMRHDQNRDQQIKADELKEVSGGGYLGKEDLPQIDRDGNKAINQDELARYLAREKD
ncbi:hypothetical protein FYK55_10530 [Roseiconus nitratireducens]|uniref:EF-hand domain-containing protein n=1 Tax=Roseiconus nitratireducens TaxID=2605748 RepID=A0A5M6DAT7_9BACT|nr:hypothetical protein [Roseiconus nitratireducens]KAA5543636.1 hypothetical protein FYK55_10530 [Roseiconus nitratireducens]